MHAGAKVYLWELSHRSRGSDARWVPLWVPLRNGGSPSTFGRTDVLAYQDPSTSAHPSIASTRQTLCLNTNATNIASVHHRHRRPPPVQRFTPYPPIHVADLSRPAARQPSHPGLSIPQLPPPRRCHTCTCAALRRKCRCRPHLRPARLSIRHARFQSEPPWGHTIIPRDHRREIHLGELDAHPVRPHRHPPHQPRQRAPGVRRLLCRHLIPHLCQNPRHRLVRDHPPRQRLPFRSSPYLGHPHAFTRGRARISSATVALTSSARPRCRRAERGT